jgi:hypothetical protein
VPVSTREYYPLGPDQVNFVPVGSLRDLVTYPHSAAEMRARGRTDADVREVLRWAHCSPEVRA